jgi:hypothetical protein
MSVFISCGHSGEVGAVSNGTTEFKEVEKIAEKVASVCHDTVTLVPRTLKLPFRISWLNERTKPGDVIIELHMDSGKSDGAMLFYLTESDPAEQLGCQLLAKYCEVTGIRNRGVKGDTASRHGRLGIVRDTRAMAFLIELGFLTDQLELEKMRSVAHKGIIEMISFILGPKVNEKISSWAQSAVEKAKQTRVILNWSAPQTPMTNEDLRSMLKNCGIKLDVHNRPLTREEWAVVLDRLGILDNLLSTK